MELTTRESQGERITTLRFGEAVLDETTTDELGTVFDRIESESESEASSLVLLFDGERSIAGAGDFPSWELEGSREELRYFARWEDLVSRLLRLKVKTIAGYQGRIGAAAVQLGLVMDLRIAKGDTRLHVDALGRGHFPGATSFWLPKLVGLGVARRMLLLGGELEADDAFQLGLLDVVGPELMPVLERTLEKIRPLNAEAVYFTRRILEDSYRQERASAIEQIKAARSKLGFLT